MSLLLLRQYSPGMEKQMTDDGMALINYLLEGPDTHRRAAEVVDLGVVLLGLVLQGGEDAPALRRTPPP
jgi:hypothetical protein